MPEDGAGDGGRREWDAGAWVTVIALVIVLGAFVAAVIRYGNARDVATAMAAITGVIGAVAGGFFGIKAGTRAGRAAAQEAERGRQGAQRMAERAQDDLNALARDVVEASERRENRASQARAVAFPPFLWGNWEEDRAPSSVIEATRRIRRLPPNQPLGDLEVGWEAGFDEVAPEAPEEVAPEAPDEVAAQAQ